ncbi:MAG: peptide ABC transporter substrate-binding protein [Anaerolineales bacterium]|nr:peptide ABC transporter substrate-binding protein [Anaerolineales bacterium]
MFAKKVLIFLVIMVFSSTLTIACGGAQPSALAAGEKEVTGSTAMVETVKEGEVEKTVASKATTEADPNALPPEETLVYNLGEGDVPTLDPALATDNPSLTVSGELFIGLASLNETGAVKPGMATEWTISADGLVYTFTLRNDVPWVTYNHATGEVEQVLNDQGQPRLVTAHDFVYGIRRTLDPATASQYAYVNWVIKNAQTVNGGADDADQNPLYGKLDKIGVRAVDDFTLAVTLTEPSAFFPSIASMAVNWAQPQGLIEEKGDRWIEAGVIHSYGPYALKAWQHDVDLTLTTNPFWPGSETSPKPQIKHIRFTLLDQSAAFANYEAGLADVVQPPLTDLDRVKADPTLSKELSQTPSACTGYLGFNVNKPPFDDVNVRKAFSWAIDRTALADNVVKSGQPARWFIRPGLTAAPDPAAGDDFGAPITASVTEAKKFLAESSYGSAQALPEITLMLSPREDWVQAAEAIQQMWRDNLGVQVNLVTQEPKVFFDTLATDPPQVWRLGWCMDYPDADNFAQVFRSDSYLNDSKWSNPAFDKLVEIAAHETDAVRRKELYIQAEKILIEEDAVIAPLMWESQVELTKPRVQRTFGLVQTFENWSFNR